MKALKNEKDIRKKLLEQIDEKLKIVKKIRFDAELYKKAADEEIAKVKEKYNAKIHEFRKELDEIDKDIKNFMRKNKGIIFSDGDTVYLDHGTILYTIKTAVRKARDVTVEVLKRLGYHDGIKVVEEVNWEKIKEWSDERLVAIGTERVQKEEYLYEIK